jgi:hypothetical protein
MIHFKNGIDSRSRQVANPTVASFDIGNGDIKFIVIGTQYGHLHTSGGDVRTWASYSGARKAATAYKAF